MAVTLLNNDITAAIVTAGGAAVISVFTVVWSKRTEQTQNIEQQIRAKKVPIYEQFIQIAFGALYKNTSESVGRKSGKNQGQMKNDNTNEVVQHLRDLTPALIIWADAEVVSSWSRFRRVSAEGTADARTIIFEFENILRALRKDLGHDDSDLKSGDLARFFINDLDETIPHPIDRNSESEQPT
ncbi:MAG: hypothetical protein K8J31_15170 [Anaerolineae bacterium]|nr:hypothetical protein [Anaerolineae bacterium]